MRKFWFYVLSVLVVLSCDDGDIITVELEFDGPLQICDNNVDSYLIYDEITDPQEALILIFERTDITESYFNQAIPEDNPAVFSINNDANRFIYRTYNQQPTFCGVLDDNIDIVTNSYAAPSGTVEVYTIVEDFDEDGIPNEFEGIDPNGDGDYSDAMDTDDDGLPDYLDEDDDDDNVLTIDENPDPNNDGNPSDAQNTNADEDSIPDYLDNDDDGDDTLTRLESEDQDPTTSFNPESPNPNIPRYLDKESDDTFDDPGHITTRYIRRFTTHFTIKGVDLEVIKFDERFYGTIETDSIYTIERED